MKKKLIISIILNVLIIIFASIGLVQNYHIGKFQMFYYYTECSNGIAIISSVLYLIFIKKNNKFVNMMKYLSSICLIITFLVVLFVLTPLKGLDTFIDNFTKGSLLYHHLLCPVISTITLLFFDNIVIKRKYRYTVLSFTILYSIILIILNILKIVEGPYPFLKIYEQPIIKTIMWSLILIGSTYIISFVFEKILIKIKK